MTVSELITLARTLADEDIAQADILVWFNQCQDSLIDDIYIPVYTTLTAVSGVFTLPDDVAHSLVLYVDDAEITNYTIIDNEITSPDLSDYDEIDIKYARYCVKLTSTNLSYTPDIARKYHNLYAYYACWQFMLSDDEPVRYEQFRSEFAVTSREMEEYYNSVQLKEISTNKWKVLR